jgi:hypothetical protein
MVLLFRVVHDQGLMHQGNCRKAIALTTWSGWVRILGGSRQSPDNPLDYVSPQVVLELGTHAEFVPHDRFMIRSFAAETFPNVVVDGDVAVVALLAKRTFWEKATILHAEYYRPPEKPILDRYSRHYYDVAMLTQGPIRADALADKDLLTLVVRHKETFYPSAWARYDLARPGSFRLSPVENRVAALQRDYRNMAVMLFGDAPKFDWIMETLTALRA